MNALKKVFSCGWTTNKSPSDFLQRHLQPFALPALLSDWPAGSGFATGQITVGELDLVQISSFEEIWRTGGNAGDAAFFKPVDIPDGYFCLGYYAQASIGSLDGSVIVAKEVCSLTPSIKPEFSMDTSVGDANKFPALAPPVDYTLIWSHMDEKGKNISNSFFWLPCAPDGYTPLGYIITNTAEKPSLTEVMCVRKDLTEVCKRADKIWSSKSKKSPFTVWDTYPCKGGKDEKAIAVGTFCCSTSTASDIVVACLKNTALKRSAMPNVHQIHALMSTFGPVYFFHPDETFFPSSVSWFFEHGALLHRKGESAAGKILPDGSNLPVGEGECWIDLPNDGSAETVMRGNLSSAKVYVHVKPALGGTFTDLVLWMFYPFNGPSTAKLGMVDLPLGKIGQHVSDWEHVTLRVSNFTGNLRNMYFAQHSGGYWMAASSLEYARGNKPVVYASRHGHASYPHPGLVLQGDKRIGIGIRNDTAQSTHSLDAGKNYEIISAEYLHENDPSAHVDEPPWLHFAGEWGPKIQYDLKAELDNMLQRVPKRLRTTVQTVFSKLPHEVCGEQGPTGPRLKNYWIGDERVKYH